MTSPATPPQASPFQSTSPMSMPPEMGGQGPRTRPGGVTFAGVLGIVYGSLGALAGLAMMFMGAAFGTLIGGFAAAGGASGGDAGIAAGLFGGAFVVMGILFLAFSAFGIVVGVKTLQGRNWARWVSVALFALAALGNLFSIGAVFPVAFLALDVAAIYFLVNADATRYFEGHAPGS